MPHGTVYRCKHCKLIFESSEETDEHFGEKHGVKKELTDHGTQMGRSPRRGSAPTRRA